MSETVSETGALTDVQILSTVAGKLGFSVKQVSKAAELFDEGATIPFIARYRQEVTGGLDEVQLRNLRDELEFRRLLEQRRETIIESIRKQEKLTPELEQAIRAATELTTLEDLYLPYKPKRKTRASVAIERGLEPLADLIWLQETETGEVEEIASHYVDPEKDVPDLEAALAGARDIVAERVSQHAEVREMLRDQLRNFATLVCKKVDDATDEKGTYETYYDFQSKVKYVKPYQVLAIDRGEREGILSAKFDVWEERTLEEIDNILITNDNAIFVEELEDAIEDAWKRLLNPSLSREIRNELSEAAGEHAISMFTENVRNLLLQPPFSTKIVMGIDPAYRTGCKVAVVDQTGAYQEGTTVFPTPPFSKIAEAKVVLARLIQKYKVDLIAIGNGTGSRETEQVVAELISDMRAADPKLEIAYLVTNEAGASVYSASDEAREEFPELDAAQRGNISIARRVQDPLAELVKIDPKSIGVGLYQHDVNQVKLSRGLGDVVESCVNHVGVNLNTASAALLTYVSGMSKTIARKVVAHRGKIGKFASRDELQDVPGVGPFRFQQAAGFLRIPESPNPLDNTAIHPESYEATKKLCDKLGIDLTRLPDEKDLLPIKLRNLKVSELARELEVGEPTLALIIENLLKPGRDPREDLPKPLLRQDVLKIEDLHEGTRLQGTVRNVVDFGAFVDIGVKVDGLLHVSQMRTDGKRVENVLEEVAVGDIIEVEVTTVDIKRQRIGLKRV
ncbi:MAG: RNA-binding transcriptional accessory protein [Candidatus Cyclonatronum sp.]|uniref:Tex family protein n=1 Tax=Cyclonatronum sp. TaxID=3024185 RepID=UPI0025BCB304|nr:Tex family protein [Cyclonatronum sp.]MCC5933891.1 RNA-binding transcriptional accessory protein [Balneolales bacterium]MCH8487235.1 RNA-binding transcriptional accessory protein [Cyclonatronum sp.]